MRTAQHTQTNLIDKFDFNFTFSLPSAVKSTAFNDLKLTENASSDIQRSVVGQPAGHQCSVHPER